MAELLNCSEQKELLKIAREAIVGYVTCGRIPPAESGAAGLNLETGCFVTIRRQHQLRGCIGNFTSERPLFRLVQDMAVSAATRDPRFYPMKPGDLSDFDLEISVLSPLEQVTSVEEIEVGTHGIYLVKGNSRGVLLPQVAAEFGWDRETFLRHTCLKAGLPEDAWQEECGIYIFSAQVFGET